MGSACHYELYKYAECTHVYLKLLSIESANGNQCMVSVYNICLPACQYSFQHLWLESFSLEMPLHKYN